MILNGSRVAGTCLSDYPLQYGTSCYKYNGSAITDYYGAQIACRETGGYLVRLGSDGETEFIRTLVNTGKLFRVVSIVMVLSHLGV